MSGGGGGGHKSCLGEVLIQVLGVGVGNDIPNVQGVCVCGCAINLVLGGGGSV